MIGFLDDVVIGGPVIKVDLHDITRFEADFELNLVYNINFLFF